MEGIKLINDKVLLKIDKERESKTKSGLIINQSTQNVQEAIVVAKSDGFMSHGVFVYLNVNVGDTVLINNGSGQKVKIMGDDYLLVSEHEILLIYTQDTKPAF